MNRIVSGFRELIEASFDCIPPKIRERLYYVDFFTGNDPVFAGLTLEENTDDGRSCRDTAHVAYPQNQLRLPKQYRRTTIVLQKPIPIYFVVHELAHVLDEVLGWRHIAFSVTEYAKTNREEAFAEAFTSWLFYNYGDEPDEKTRILFEGLKEGKQWG